MPIALGGVGVGTIASVVIPKQQISISFWNVRTTGETTLTATVAKEGRKRRGLVYDHISITRKLLEIQTRMETLEAADCNGDRVSGE